MLLFVGGKDIPAQLSLLIEASSLSILRRRALINRFINKPQRTTIMNRLPGKQQGGSLIVTIIILAILGIGVFIGLQYMPQYMESGSVDKVLDNIELDHQDAAFTSTNEIKQRIANKFNINDMNDMMQNVTVKEIDGGYEVNVKYERELNLIYEKKPMDYDRTITLTR